MGNGLSLRRAAALALVALGVAPGAVAPAHAAPSQTDADRDGVFDDLESRIRAAAPSRAMRVIVTLDRGATADRARALERGVASLDVARRFDVVDALAATVAAGQVRALARAPGVEHVEADGRVHAANASAQQWFGVSEARLDVPGLDGDADGSPATYSPADLVAAVIDTGIDAGHRDLDGGKVLAFQDFTDGSHSDVDVAFDDHGHGTHVAGTIAGDGGGGRADGLGVAPGAGLVGLKVLDSEGSGWTSDVIAAIDWVWKDPDGAGPAVPNGVLHGVEVINLSLGGVGCSDGSDAESRAVDNAARAGYVVTVAAGNDGFDPDYDCTISSPAAAAEAITVGAMADVDRGGFRLAGFSGRGPTADGRVKPDIAAPGVGISSAQAGTATGYDPMSGTSMATPFVAGVALLMRDADPTLTSAQVKQSLMATAIDWGSPGLDSDHGAGRLDAYAALAAVDGGLTSPPAGLPPYERIESSVVGERGAARTFELESADGFPLAVGLTVPEGDFDLYLHDADGTLVASSEAMDRHEVLQLPDPSGSYTLRVAIWDGSGDFYLDVSGAIVGTTTAEPAPLPAAAPEPEPEPLPADDPPADDPPADDPPAEDTVVESPPADDAPATGEPAAGEPAEEAPETAPLLAAPSLDDRPRIRGRARKGRRLAVRRGAWTGESVRFTYRWLRCNARGKRCKRIRGATGRRYRLRRADVRRRIVAKVAVRNAAGRDRARTRPTKRVRRPR